MDVLDLIKSRHSVRQYTNQAIEEEKRKKIKALVDEINEESGLFIQVVYDEPQCFSSFLARYGKFEGVKNYIALVGTKEDQEKAGYYGEQLVLTCQGLGLNTCWVALTHGKAKVTLERGQKLLILIALGYGKTQGLPRKTKSINALSQKDQKAPWFDKGIEAVQLAPTAINQQKFFFALEKGQVKAKSLGGFYSKIDLGIAKYHFEAVTGRKVNNWI